MKNLTIVLLLLVAGRSKAQNINSKADARDSAKISLFSTGTIIDLFSKPETKSRNKSIANQPVCFVDSIKIANGHLYIDYIDVNQVASINVSKYPQYPDGAIYFTLKDHQLILQLQQSRWLSLNDIARLNIDEKERSKPIIYLLNDKLLTDTANIRLPVICLNPVSIIKASETPYFKTVFPEALLMIITTSSLPAKPPEIMIRGSVAAN